VNYMVEGRLGRGWRVLDDGMRHYGYVPEWIRRTLYFYTGRSGDPDYCRGRHYEYKVVVADVGHTHDNIVLRRRLRRSPT